MRIRHQVNPRLTLDVQFAVGDECAILFGRSGAGKSTILRCIAGIVEPTAGRITLGATVLFDRVAHRSVPMRSRGVGMIFQEDLLFPHLCVRDNVLFGVATKDAADRQRRMDELSAMFGLGLLLARRPDTLSGGERQRVGLARALAPRPRLLLCDEPISAVDAESRTALIGHLRQIRVRERIPVVYVTHNIAEAVAIGDRLFELDGGTIVSQGRPLDVFAASRRSSVDAAGAVQNVFAGSIDSHDETRGVTQVRLSGGSVLCISRASLPVGMPVVVGIRAEDILLARERVTNISAQNVLTGTVTEIVTHGGEVEVLVDCGVRFLASVVPAAVASLQISPGVPVWLVIKARSCHLLL